MQNRALQHQRQRMPVLLSQYKPNHCPICNNRMNYAKGYIGGEKATRDHILPRARGGDRLCMMSDVRNITIICKTCNETRGKADHCWAVVACARAIVEHKHVDSRNRRVRQLLSDWQGERDRNRLTFAITRTKGLSSVTRDG